MVSKINTGGKYDSKVFQKSVGLNGVGTKAVNALSSQFLVQSVREGQLKAAEFSQGQLTCRTLSPRKPASATARSSASSPTTRFSSNYRFIPEFLESQIRNYCYLNAGLAIYFNGQKYVSENGLLDLLER